jgi:hypothetical protein
MRFGQIPFLVSQFTNQEKPKLAKELEKEKE